MEKFKLKSEVAYILAIVILAFAVNIMEVANCGMSMIVLPAYIVSQKFSMISFGQSEYIIQGILFIIFCLVMKGIKKSYYISFMTGILYGTVLDLWKNILFHNMIITNIMIRILFYIVGMLLSAFAIALFYQTYLYPQVYDFFVKGISNKYHLEIRKVKTIFDLSFLVLSILLSLLFFHQLAGIGVGTIIMAILNGSIIDFFKKQLHYIIRFEPYFYHLDQKLMKDIE